MLRVTIKLLPDGDEALARTPASMTVANDDSGTRLNGRYEFEVEAHLPLFGLLVRYKGWLEPQAQSTMS